MSQEITIARVMNDDIFQVRLKTIQCEKVLILKKYFTPSDTDENEFLKQFEGKTFKAEDDLCKNNSYSG